MKRRSGCGCGCLAPALLLLVLFAGIYLLRFQFMTALGNYLVVNEPPEHVDAVVVLAGDQTGERVLKAAELVKAGWAPYALVSGTPVLLTDEAELNVAYAVSKGYPPTIFRPLERDTHSTREETVQIASELKSKNIHSILLVTSNYHTRRAKALMHNAAPHLRMRVIAAPDRFFSPDGWWKNRNGARLFLYEWLKTFAAWTGH
jgi:uncharacterized SAM-binding protein YcdF (DUF218 family)